MNRPFKMPPQIFRLILLAAGIVVSYGIARYFLTPKTFGEFGWYRGEALVELADRPITYAGKATCVEVCHSDEGAKLAKDGHKTLSCEACHGAAADHADKPEVTKPPKLGYSTCIRCHEANPSRPKWHKQIVSKTHYPGSKCSECHVPHMPTEVP
jgi:hypothetical protein